MKKIVIKRSKWRCGGLSDRHLGDSCMLNSIGLMCCLGCISKENGVPDDELFDKDYPSQISHKNIPDWMIDDNGKISDLAIDMAIINDNHKISQKERESELIKAAKKADIELEFKGELI